MEKVFLIPEERLSKGYLAGKEYSERFFIEGEAVVDKVLGSNRYLVILGNGTKITAIGPDSINKGAKVHVSPLSNTLVRDREDYLKLSTRNGNRLSAFIPMKLLSGTSEAKLELHVSKEKNGFLSKRNPIVYLVFSVKTRTYGLIQWSVYLKEHRVLIQFYAEKDGVDKNDTVQMIQDFEVSLRKKGFFLLAPTVILKKPFKVPTGFQLNIRG